MNRTSVTVEMKNVFLPKDAEIKTASNGNKYAKFSVGAKTRYKTKDEWKEKQQYYNCSLWGKNVDDYGPELKKGALVNITAKLENRSWVDKEGNKKTILDIIVTSIDFLKRISNVTTKTKTDDAGMPAVDDSVDMSSDFDDDDAPF